MPEKKPPANRTKLELKPVTGCEYQFFPVSANRTKLELKHKIDLKFGLTDIYLPIVPNWN